MLTDYIDRAMQHARYERIEDGTIFGSIADLPDFKGVWADADTVEACRDELRDVLEGWILLHSSDHTPLSSIEGLTLDVGRTGLVPLLGPTNVMTSSAVSPMRCAASIEGGLYWHGDHIQRCR